MDCSLIMLMWKEVNSYEEEQFVEDTDEHAGIGIGQTCTKSTSMLV